MSALNSIERAARPGAILRIGDLLIAEGLATPAQVQDALHQQYSCQTYMPLGHILIAQRIITRRQLISIDHRLPTIYYFREAVEDGGLMSYGANIPDLSRRAGKYVARILKGERPADLPVEQPTKFDFLLNVRAAKTLGLTIPQTLLLRADQVIE